MSEENLKFFWFGSVENLNKLESITAKLTKLKPGAVVYNKEDECIYMWTGIKWRIVQFLEELT